MRSKAKILGGLFVTVAGGLIVAIITETRELFMVPLIWAWDAVLSVWGMLQSFHQVPGWVILLVVIPALFGLFVLGVLLKDIVLDKHLRPYRKYTEDMIDGVRWRWRWAGNKISNLWCYCPKCDAQLVYSEGLVETSFICERCPTDGSLEPPRKRGRVVATVDSGDRHYAVAAAEREILRRIRTGEP